MSVEVENLVTKLFDVKASELQDMYRQEAEKEGQRISSYVAGPIYPKSYTCLQSIGSPRIDFGYREIIFDRSSDDDNVPYDLWDQEIMFKLEHPFIIDEFRLDEAALHVASSNRLECFLCPKLMGSEELEMKKYSSRKYPYIICCTDVCLTVACEVERLRAEHSKLRREHKKEVRERVQLEKKLQQLQGPKTTQNDLLDSHNPISSNSAGTGLPIATWSYSKYDRYVLEVKGSNSDPSGFPINPMYYILKNPSNSFEGDLCLPAKP